ncbi:TetR family transcriptional regulator [Antrihabitans cavernicola]|uniref:TetR family transcriptional regulator n=1 Tax=Antrihabitans cavernicola TaxID=2495913 RepID=A0A5A7SHC0_9NOCA|nr:TetR family transcriptional regulator [Spelaeibacter cavernicola]KAA0024552.1 TetR family transcriptional regulator [Spelaeibacter cavernicola]
MITESGLRDRKKAATRAALSEAAVRLSAQRGFESVTAEAIASEAGVSTRTFHNYFASKEDAVLSQVESSVQEWVELLRARPEGEPIWDSLQHLAMGIVSDPERSLEEMRAVSQLIEESPALMAKKLQMHDNVNRTFGEAIAARTGTDIDIDLFPNLLMVAVGGAVKTVLELALSGNVAGRTPQELMTEAFDQLRSGLPQVQSLPQPKN